MRLALVVLAVACGRVDFDPRGPHDGAAPDVTAIDAACTCHALDRVTLDNFDRADGPIGAPWQGDTTLFTVHNNQLLATMQGVAMWSAQTAVLETAAVTLVHVGQNQEAGILVGAPTLAGTTDYVYTSLHNQVGSPHIDYSSVVNSTFVGGSIPHVVVDGERIQVMLDVDQLTIVLDGSDVGPFQVPWPHKGAVGYIGVYSYYSGVGTLFDDFGGGACCAL